MVKSLKINSVEHCVKKNVEVYCPDCDETYCSSCYSTDHQTIKKSKHQKTSIKEQKMKCKVHDKHLELFCYDCDLELCSFCTILHKEHKFDTFENAESKMKKELLQNLFSDQKTILKTKFDSNQIKIEQLKEELKNLELEQRDLKTELDQLDGNYNEILNLKNFKDVHQTFKVFNQKFNLSKPFQLKPVKPLFNW